MLIKTDEKRKDTLTLVSVTRYRSINEQVVNIAKMCRIFGEDYNRKKTTHKKDNMWCILSLQGKNMYTHVI